VQPYQRHTNREKATQPSARLSADTFGPTRTASKNGERYKVSVLDEYTDYKWLRFCKSKADIPGLLIILLKRITNQVALTIKALVTDNGTEVHDYCDSLGIKQIFTTPGSSVQNGAVERSHRVDTEASVCLLDESELPTYLWPYAMRYSCFVRNRVPRERDQHIMTCTLDRRYSSEKWITNLISLDRKQWRVSWWGSLLILKIYGCITIIRLS
jgi:hypothetical protein